MKHETFPQTKPQWTNQTFYAAVKEHLLLQNERSIDGAGYMCLYRGPNNLRCAIGALIADEDYRLELEGYGVDCANIRALFPEVDRRLMIGLQNIHDKCEVSGWRRALENLGTRWGLD